MVIKERQHPAQNRNKAIPSDHRLSSAKADSKYRCTRRSAGSGKGRRPPWPAFPRRRAVRPRLQARHFPPPPSRPTAAAAAPAPPSSQIQRLRSDPETNATAVVEAKKGIALSDRPAGDCRGEERFESGAD